MKEQTIIYKVDHVDDGCVVTCDDGWSGVFKQEDFQKDFGNCIGQDCVLFYDESISDYDIEITFKARPSRLFES